MGYRILIEGTDEVVAELKGEVVTCDELHEAVEKFFEVEENLFTEIYVRDDNDVAYEVYFAMGVGGGMFCIELRD